MTTIVCFGDSNTYGYNPETGMRYPKNIRWTGILQQMLGKNADVIEEGCNGRTTVFVDPDEPWKTGRPYLKPCLHSHRVVDYLVLMLGSNDLKTVFHASAEDIAQGMETLIQDTYAYCSLKQTVRPRILLVSPHLIGKGITTSAFAGHFDETAPERSAGLAPLYRALAEKYGCLYLNAAEYIQASAEDSLHLTPDAHMLLARQVCRILAADMRRETAPRPGCGAKPVVKSTGKVYLEGEEHDLPDLREIVKILCSPDEGCPWDSSQTLESLKSCLSNEADEVLEAIDRKDRENLCEELGDVLLQVVMQSELAQRNGWFTLDDVIQGISDKMIRRHPHVFTDEKFDSEEDIHERWKQIKAKEKLLKRSSKKPAAEAAL